MKTDIKMRRKELFCLYKQVLCPILFTFVFISREKCHFKSDVSILCLCRQQMIVNVLFFTAPCVLPLQTIIVKHSTANVRSTIKIETQEEKKKVH